MFFEGQSMHIILGSQSPRRKEIFEFFNLPFSCISSGFDESKISFTSSPEEYVNTLAMKKAEAIAKDRPGDLIISADTIVYFKNKLYEKPRDEKEAFSFLKELNGQTHEVYSGVCVQLGEIVYTQAEKSLVTFQNFTDQEISSYIRLIDPMDKAGSYAVQEGGCLIVKGIEGCFYNVMGLPVQTLRKLLLKFQIDLLNPKLLS